MRKLPRICRASESMAKPAFILVRISSYDKYYYSARSVYLGPRPDILSTALGGQCDAGRRQPRLVVGGVGQAQLPPRRRCAAAASRTLLEAWSDAA